ncbi:MAG: nucleoside-triphosphatase [Clostridiales Family XIII bacterium]|jgi:nucleoside-triphosphatase THEP1|nr:nucleoside-triphosphatase [Clostridiales Family XIII bacterium]
MSHIFLTGARGVGKTTALSGAMDRMVEAGAISADEIAGFRTAWIADELYILPYAPGSHGERPGGAAHERGKIPPGARPIARRTRGKQVLEVHPEVFDEDGAAILRSAVHGQAGLPSVSKQPTQMSPAADAASTHSPCAELRPQTPQESRAAPPPTPPKLIIMDELGFMETDALVFRETVMSVLGGGIPVLGVLRQDTGPFLGAVRGHPRVEVVEVTERTRDVLPRELAAALLPRLS